MKMPKRPPDFQLLWEKLVVSNNTRALEAIYRVAQDSAHDGKYFHWDDLRHRKSPDGLSSEQWWVALKIARSGLLKELPLKDATGKPSRFGLPDPAHEHLHHIDQKAAGGIMMPEGQIANAGTRDRYLVRSLMEEAITSSQLEGAATTRKVAKEMIRTKRPPRDRSERMILNNYWAMERIRRLTGAELTPGLLLELHTILTKGTLDDPSAAGRFRRADESVEVATLYNEVLHTPPPADELPRRLKALCDFANMITPKYFIHPVIRAIILHFWLAYDHPFVDGNGRCARALFYWCMVRQGYWLCEFISISQIIKKAPVKYGKAFLHTETDDNDLTYFIFHQLDVIRRAIDELHQYIAKKAEELHRIEGLIRSFTGLNYRQLALLSHALRHPNARYSMESHRASHGVVYQTARTDLNSLAAKGLLRQATVGKTFAFFPVEDLEGKLRDLK